MIVARLPPAPHHISLYYTEVTPGRLKELLIFTVIVVYLFYRTELRCGRFSPKCADVGA